MKITDFLKEILPKVFNDLGSDNPSDYKRKITKKIRHQVSGNNNETYKDQRTIISKLVGDLNKVIVKSMN